MKAYAVKPRVLADDLQILSQGDNHLETIEFAFTKTHKHIEDIGGRLGPKKSITFASTESSRAWLRSHRWRRVGHTIQVITDGRDLGAHMSAAANRIQGTTLTRRMEATALEVDSLNKVRAPYEKRQRSFEVPNYQKHSTGAR